MLNKKITDTKNLCLLAILKDDIKVELLSNCMQILKCQFGIYNLSFKYFYMKYVSITPHLHQCISKV